MEKFKNVSLSHATMREEDLIPCFLNFLKRYAPFKYSNIMANDDYHFVTEFSIYNTEDSAYFLNEVLFDVLNELAPAGFYFGAHPGDGSDYGFWECEDFDLEPEDGVFVGSDFAAQFVKDSTAYGLRVTHNGYQWHTIRLNNVEEIREISRVINHFLAEIATSAGCDCTPDRPLPEKPESCPNCLHPITPNL